MLIFICAAWHIWKQRNDFIFDRNHPSSHWWLVNFKQDLLTHILRVKEANRIAILEWLTLFNGITQCCLLSPCVCLVCVFLCLGVFLWRRIEVDNKSFMSKHADQLGGSREIVPLQLTVKFILMYCSPGFTLHNFLSFWVISVWYVGRVLCMMLLTGHQRWYFLSVQTWFVRFQCKQA